MEQRKIVQVAYVPESEKFDAALIAVASDGTVWESSRSSGSGYMPWQRLPDLPQDKE